MSVKRPFWQEQHSIPNYSRICSLPLRYLHDIRTRHSPQAGAVCLHGQGSRLHAQWSTGSNQICQGFRGPAVLACTEVYGNGLHVETGAQGTVIRFPGAFRHQVSAILDTIPWSEVALAVL